MAMLFLMAFGAAVILYAAVRIILGWVLPAQQVKAFDAAASALLSFILKLSIVLLAALLVYAFYMAESTPRP